MVTEVPTKAPCNRCGLETQQVILYAREVSDPDQSESEQDDLDSCWVDKYSVLECRGCNSISIRHESHIGVEEQLNYYPPRVARRLPLWLGSVPIRIRFMVHETYWALAAGCPSLATMGARTVLDLVFLKVVGDVGPFWAKLEAMQSSGYISRRQREHLERVLDAGNAAAHRGFAPSADLVNQMMDIVEHLLQTVYVLKHSARRLKRETPRRRPRRRPRSAV